MLKEGVFLGHYRVVAKLGAGGMGEVWQARDERLERDVAIKVLPDELASDVDRLARFEREAKVLASLNHQNIATLYGVEAHDSEWFLVMELVDGETLAARLDRGALAVDDALSIARQIAAGLGAAHEHGVVHRDLKPANVMVTADGKVKILDFGLARAGQEEQAGTDLTRSPTLTAQMTAAGVLIGTAAYMSPEQVRGRPTDRRADIWAFGCVLHEMLTGRQLFAGETVSDVLAEVLKRDVDLAALPAAVAPPVRRLLARCLQRDPSHRLRDLGDAIFELEEGEVAQKGSPLQRLSWSGVAGWGVALVVFVAALVRLGGSGATSRDPVIAEILPPEGTEFVFHGDSGSPPVLSPDGSKVVFGAAVEGGVVSLWLRSFRTGETRRLEGTEGGFAPFWSPDGESIGFFDLLSLKRMQVELGAPLALSPVSIARGGVWTRDNQIIFAPDYNTGLHVIPAVGGEPRPLTFPSPGRHTSHRWPVLLPDGSHVLYLAISHASPLSGDNELRLVGIDGRNDRPLVPSLSSGAVTRGRLLFVRDRTLMAQHLDVRQGILTGEMQILAPAVFLDLDTWHGAFGAADDILLYQVDSSAVGSRLALMDLEGNELESVGEPAMYRSIDASPDGRHVAVSVGSPSDIWVVDLVTARRTRLTFGPASATSPVWSADGTEVFYRSFDARSPSRILAKPASGAGEPRVVFEDSELLLRPAEVSPDGRFLILEDAFYAPGADIWVLELDGDGEPKPLIARPGTQTQTALSPDGSWLAYRSDDVGGRRSYYVEPFAPSPDAATAGSRAGRWEVSQEQGAGNPHWGTDGSRIFHLTLDRRLVSIEVDVVGESIRVGPPRLITQTRAASTLRAWDVVPGSERIVMITQATQTRAPLTAVIGLHQLLLEAER